MGDAGISRFAVDATELEEASVVHVRGELDVATSGTLRATLRETRDVPLVVIDLSGAPFVDRCGVEVLVEIQAERRRHGRSFLVIDPPPSLTTVLRACHWPEQLRWRRTADR